MIFEIISNIKFENNDYFQHDSSFFTHQYFKSEKIYKNESLRTEEYQEILSNPIYKLSRKNTTFKINPNIDENIKKSLKWYTDPNNIVNNMTPEKIKLITLFLQENLNFDSIFSKIFLFVYKSISKNTNLKEVNFVKEVENMKNSIEKLEDIQKIMDNFSDLNTSVIFSLIMETNNLIEEINKEINHFRFEINQTATGILHEIVLIVFWNLYTILEYYKAYLPLRINNQNKRMQKDMFLSVLTNDLSKFDADRVGIILKNAKNK